MILGHRFFMLINENDMDYNVIITVHHDSYGQESITVSTNPEGAVSPEELDRILLTLINSQ